MRRFSLVAALVCMLLLGLAAQPASAQYPPPQGRWAAARQQRRAMAQARRRAAHQNANGNASAPVAKENAVQPHPNSEGAAANGVGAAPSNETNTGQGNARGMAGLPPKWVENLRDRPPQEQERFMQNNERFQSLPPGRQQQVRQNLQKYNNLTPQQKDALKQRERTWQQMTPAQRQTVKNDLLPKWQQMTPDRRQAINGRLHTLQGMSAGDREKALNDPKFMQGLNPDEQSMVKDLSSLRSTPNQ